MTREYKFQISADYFQIYFWDADLLISTINIDADWWTEEDHLVMVSVKENNQLIVAETFRDFTVPLTVFFHSSQFLTINLDEWDQASACDIWVPSGFLRITSAGWDEYSHTALKSGWHRLVFLAGGRDTISPDGIDGSDSYQCHLWPISKPNGLVVLKHRDIENFR